MNKQELAFWLESLYKAICDPNSAYIELVLLGQFKQVYLTAKNKPHDDDVAQLLEIMQSWWDRNTEVHHLPPIDSTEWIPLIEKNHANFAVH